MKNKKVLMVEHADPFEFGGGSYASLAHIKAISDIYSGNVDVCIADRPEKKHFLFPVNHVFWVPPRSIVARVLSIVTGEIHRYTKYVRHRLLTEDYDVCVYDGGRISGSLARFSKRRGKKVITFHHNYEPEYVWDNTKNILLKIVMMMHVKKLERNAYKWSDVNLFLSKHDMDTFATVYGQCLGKNYVVGTYEARECVNDITKRDVAKKKCIVITGGLCDKQTIDGIEYFFKDLYEYVPKDYLIVVAGKNPSLEVERLCSEHENVKLIANPSSMEPVLRQADLYLCPTRTGSGVKQRVMDGLKAGVPIVVHEVSARGYDVFFYEPFFQRFSSKESFKQALDKVIDCIDSNEFLSYKIFESYNKFFSYPAGYERVKKALSQSQVV